MANARLIAEFVRRLRAGSDPQLQLPLENTLPKAPPPSVGTKALPHRGAVGERPDNLGVGLSPIEEPFETNVRPRGFLYNLERELRRADTDPETRGLTKRQQEAEITEELDADLAEPPPKVFGEENLAEEAISEAQREAAFLRRHKFVDPLEDVEGDKITDELNRIEAILAEYGQGLTQDKGLTKQVVKDFSKVESISKRIDVVMKEIEDLERTLVPKGASEELLALTNQSSRALARIKAPLSQLAEKIRDPAQFSQLDENVEKFRDIWDTFNVGEREKFLGPFQRGGRVLDMPESIQPRPEELLPPSSTGPTRPRPKSFSRAEPTESGEDVLLRTLREILAKGQPDLRVR